MLLRTITKILTRLRDAGPSPDGELLERFLARRDEAAFDALVRRHGPMVLRVCLRVLHQRQDAEDAFQATFIVLARRASSIAKVESLASWLHGVAYRIALKAKTAAARRHTHERRAGVLTTPATTGSAAAEPAADLRAVLDEEVQRLPEKYRAPVILCYLEGKTNQEAALQLGCPLGTVATRLTYARDLLRNRLTQRGLALSAAGLGVSLGESVAHALPPALATATARGAALLVAGQAPATGLLTPAALASADAALAALTAQRWKIAVGTLLALLVIGGTVAFLVRSNGTRMAAADADYRVALHGHTARVVCVAFSTDGQRIATASPDGTVKLWDRATGNVQYTLPIGGSADALALSPDGNYLAVASGTVVQRWDLQPPRRVFDLEHVAAVRSVAFSPDSSTLAAGCGTLDYAATPTPGFGMHVWNAVTGEKRYSVPAGPTGVLSVVFAPGGTLQTGAASYATATEKERRLTEASGIRYLAVARSPDARKLAFAQNTRAGPAGYPVHLLDADKDNKASGIYAHKDGEVRALAFSADSTLLASASTKVMVWNLQRNQRQVTFNPGTWPVSYLAFAADGRTLAVAVDTEVQVWDIAEPRLLRTLAGFTPYRQ